jgi:hypothetical protein
MNIKLSLTILGMIIGTMIAAMTTQLAFAETDGTEGRPTPGNDEGNRDGDNTAHQTVEGSPGGFIKDEEYEKGQGCTGSGFSDEFSRGEKSPFITSGGNCRND